VVTVEDAVFETRRVLEALGRSVHAEHLAVAYAMFAGTPLCRLRARSLQHVPPLLSSIQGDESMDTPTSSAAAMLRARIALALGTVDPRTAADPDPGTAVRGRDRVYRIDGDDVLHYTARRRDGSLSRFATRAVAGAAGGPPVVAAPGLRTGAFIRVGDTERDLAWREAGGAVAAAWRLGLYDGRSL
jgi:hypothetical protein